MLDRTALGAFGDFYSENTSQQVFFLISSESGRSPLSFGIVFGENGQLLGKLRAV